MYDSGLLRRALSRTCLEHYGSCTEFNAHASMVVSRPFLSTRLGAGLSRLAVCSHGTSWRFRAVDPALPQSKHADAA